MCPRLSRTCATALLASLAGCAALPGIGSRAVRPGPGISLELARHRSATLAGVEYDLALDITGTDTVPGEVTVSVRRLRGARDLVLDFRGPALHEVVANGAPVSDYRWANGHVVIPAARLQPGANQLRFRFTTRMAPAGASIIRYEEAEPGAPAGARPSAYLYTLLVPADASQLFPAFDQPDLKGVFRMEITAPEGWQVVANGPLVELVPAPAGVRWRFAPTQPISTYLAAFAAGPWATWRSTPRGRLPITLYARGARREEVDAATLIHDNRQALEWLEGYFGVGYPFQKFDMLLAPAFPFGGMEHAGAIFYNESSFVFREVPTETERLGRKVTIYHEVAHQWLGDLVTMRWFDDLWLKEGFATYMAARMQAELDPESGAWKTFYLRNKPPAYSVDATSGTTPVWQQLENLDLAKSNYGPIVYNKAPAILRQLQHLVGEEAFRSGVQQLLRRHAFGAFTWRDLLAALEDASGISLAAFGEQYILRSGMPRIETVLRTRAGKIEKLQLVQRPVRALPGDPGGWWPGKVRVRLGYGQGKDVVLPVDFTGPVTVVAEAAGRPTPDFVFANDDDYGYGRFVLDSTSAAALVAGVGSLEDDLLRAMVWGALWDLVGEGRLPVADYLELVLRELQRETDEQIASHLLGRATVALDRYLPPGRRAAVQPAFEALLLIRMDDNTLSYGMRKASLDAFLQGARTREGLSILADFLTRQRTFDGEALRQPSRWTAIETLLALAHPEAASLYETERRTDTSAEAARRAFIAGAAIPSAPTKAEYYRRYLEDTELNEEWVTASLGAFNHPAHAELSRPFLRPALEELPWLQANRRIFFVPQWIAAFIGGHADSAALGEVDDYLRDHRSLPADLRSKVLQERDVLEAVVRVRG